MAYEFDDLRAVLTQKAANVASAIGVEIQMPNAPFTEPTGEVWLNFWYKLGKTDQAELGGPAALEVTVGLMQFDVLYPEETGDGEAMRIASQVRRSINRKQWLVGSHSYVTLDAADLVTDLPSSKAGWARMCVDATFLFHHRNPDADPLQEF